MSACATLPEAAAVRFAKLAGMIGSDHDGEALNAARAATRLLRDNGMTWGQALTSRPVTAHVSRPQTDHPSSSPRPVPPTTARYRKLMLCRSVADIFNVAEKDFIRDMAAIVGFGSRRALTGKQEAWIERLHIRAVQASAERRS